MLNIPRLCLLFCAILKLTWALVEKDHPTITGRVTGGADAVDNSAPFIVSFQFQRQHYCAGSILNLNWVLTAAHCLELQHIVKKTILVAGTINIRKESTSVESRSIDYFLTNTLYTGGTTPYDIGLVYTKTPFTWSPAVSAIALPSKDYNPSGDAVLYGWGSTSRTSVEIFPSILQVATVPIISLTTCAKAMGPKSIYVHDTNLCTGPLTGKVGICRADSGGPLVQKINGKTTLIGVVSWGKTPCGQNDSPSVYVKVSSLLEWIEKNQVAPIRV